ncbi:MAG: universal stress protein [Rhodocyclaceae bacterium]|jgi:nucleotide-binding universal stress UspA family protein|nr:universal stress protein [Rhodocyclaceae bacterium]
MDTRSPAVIRTIVAATDLSAAANLAVEQAAVLAKRFEADLSVLHVFDDGLWAAIKSIYDAERWTGADPVLAARDHLSRQAQELAARHGISVVAETRTGGAAAEIARFLTECQADLLVVGEHGEDWIGDTFLGGTALKVLAQANVPVLLVRRPASAEWASVIVAMDFSDNARRALQLALDWFPSSSLYITHAYFVPFEGRMRMAGATDADLDHYRKAELARAESSMQSLRDSLAVPATAHVQWLNLHGHPAAVLFELSERLAADLIVIGKHGGSALEERIIGSVTQNVLYHASSNVLLVP